MTDVETRWRDLMVASLAGDSRAYTMLLQELRQRLARYFSTRLSGALSAHRDDLVQDTLLSIHSRRATYDPSRPLTAWVHAIARYRLIDFYRQQKLRVTVPLDDDAAVFAADDAHDAGSRLDVERVLASIPARPATLIRQVRLGGASIAEAAATAGISEAAAKVSIHRALKSLTARFSRGGADER